MPNAWQSRCRPPWLRHPIPSATGLSAGAAASKAVFRAVPGSGSVGLFDGADSVAGGLLPTAISTERLCTQLTPSSAA